MSETYDIAPYGSVGELLDGTSTRYCLIRDNGTAIGNLSKDEARQFAAAATNAVAMKNPAPTPPASRADLAATNWQHADYLEDLAQPGGALWHSPLDRARLLLIARRLRGSDE